MNKQNNEKYNSFGIVIDAKKESANPYYELAQLEPLLLNSKDFFVATIIHDKDKDLNNYPKRTHLHAYLDSHKKYTKKQFLEALTGLLNINENQISVNPDNNGFLLVQYLTHKNDKNKYQYEFENIKTNNTDLLEQKYNQIYLSPQEKADQLEHDIFYCKTISHLVSQQGLEIAKKYQSVFNQIKQEQKLSLDQLANIIERMDNFIDWLEEHTRILKQGLSFEIGLNGNLPLTQDQQRERLVELELIYGEISCRFREFFVNKN